MIKTSFYGEINLEIWELMVIPFLLSVIFGISFFVRNQRIRKEPAYKYYIPGLVVKIAGGIMFCLIYLFYYGGGDTISYYESSLAFVNLFYKNPFDAIYVAYNEYGLDMYPYFDYSTGYPLAYIWTNKSTYTVVRVVTPFLILTNKSYFLATILISWVSYLAIWRIFILFQTLYRAISWELAIAFLFIPSVIFWGGGISKDTITLAASCWFVVSFYKAFIARRQVVKSVIFLFIASWILVSIKPYIIICLIPGVLIWVSSARLRSMKSQFASYVLAPLIYGVIPIMTIVFMSVFGDLLGEYSIDNIINKAVVTQDDLKRDYYEGNSFDIGEIDPTPIGFLSKAPIAIVSGLFRPFLWEVQNVVMLVSALETTILLALFLYFTFKIGLNRLFRFILQDPLLFFLISFSMLFAFALGLTTPNFGALVRFKIPMLPFFVAFIFLLEYHAQLRLFFLRRSRRRRVQRPKQVFMPEQSTR